MMFNIALKANLHTVLDADGLNILAKSGGVLSDHCILTPHPSEAARLLCCSSLEIQHDRLHAIHALRAKYGKCIVLKGSGSLILGEQDNKMTVLCEYGNPGMGSAGMGDVLSGVIGGLMAQGYSATTSAILGVYVHSFAADIAALEGERGMLATDLMPHIRHLVNPGNKQ